MGLTGYLFFLATVYCFFRPCRSFDLLPVVYKGTEDTQHPFVVALIFVTHTRNTDFLDRSCTGSAVTVQWVVTAAHCLSDKVEYVQYGDMLFKPEETSMKSKVLDKIKHPGYVKLVPGSWPKNDIGLVRVEPMDLNELGRLSSQEFVTRHGMNVVYAGFGKHEESDTLDFLSDKPLLFGEGIVIPCPEPKISGVLATDYICVSSGSNVENYQYTLPGDSGGPLIHDEAIIGVLGQGLRNHGIPKMMFTPISHYWTWIHKVMSTSRMPRFYQKGGGKVS